MKKTDYKLDFNERSDSLPAWLNNIHINTDTLWRYPDRRPLELQLEADMNLPADSILLTNGGDEGIDLLFKRSTIYKEGLCIPLPCFSQYSHNASVWQNDCQFIKANPAQPLAVDSKELAQAIKANQWLVITRPNNPTGEFISKQIVLDLIKTAQAQNAKVFIDEAYIEFAMAEQATECIDIAEYAAFENVVVLRTFSKAFGIAGARVGYLVGTPKLIKEFRQLAPPFNVSVVSLQLAAAAWQNRYEVSPYIQQIATNRNQIVQFFEQNKLAVFPSQGNFVLFNTSELQKTLLFNVLRRQGIVIKTQLNGLPDAVRITVPFNIQPLINALQQVLNPPILAFDMDGVLIDTSQSYDECIKKTVKMLSNEVSNVDIQDSDIERLRFQGGYNNDWDLSYELLRQNGFQGTLDDVISLFQKLYLGSHEKIGLISAEQVLISETLLNKVINHKCLKTAVVTGRPRLEAKLGLQQLQFQPDILISADDVKQQKPNPEGLRQVQSNLLHASENCSGSLNKGWFIGDTVDDMQAGQAAGCVCIGIGKNTANLTTAGADLVVSDINQIEVLL